jgi:hypothetical protein
MASTDRIHRVFQHLAGCTHQRHRWEGQRPSLHTRDSYLRTVIVQHRLPASLRGLDHLFIPPLQEGALRMASEDSPIRGRFQRFRGSFTLDLDQSLSC